MTTTPARYVTAQEVAVLFGVSPMTVYRLVNDGALTAIRVGRNIRIDSRAVGEYMRAFAIQPGDLDGWADRPTSREAS